MVQARSKAARRACEQFVLVGSTQPAIQLEIAERAYTLWLERGFRNGSPQEDWLRAQQELQKNARQVTPGNTG